MRPLDDIGLDEFDDDDPNDPRHRDFDLSESAPYDFDRSADEKPWFLQRWFLVLVSVLLVFSLLLPLLVRI